LQGQPDCDEKQICSSRCPPDKDRFDRKLSRVFRRKRRVPLKTNAHQQLGEAAARLQVPLSEAEDQSSRQTKPFSAGEETKKLLPVIAPSPLFPFTAHVIE